MRHHSLPWGPILLLLVLVPHLSLANDLPAGAGPIVDIPRLDSPPRLEAFLSMRPEGRVEERMARVEGLVQRSPHDGEPATQRTHIYLGYDDKHLYSVFVAFDDEPGRIRSNMSRRESVFGDDIVEIMLDTFQDQRRAYAFVANPHGVQWDAIWTEGQGFDMAFDTVWRSRGQLTDRGYVVWMAIPFRSLRFPRTPTQSWGVIFIRDIPRNNESAFWPPVSNRIEGRLSQEATLRGIEDISPGLNIQLIPFVTARSFRVLEPEAPQGPSFVRDRADPDAGLDGKFVFRDSLVLDLTANPDFSEVESDSPRVTVNQRFEVFFPEKRPFFLENSSFFRTPINLLFTRRIVEPRIGGRLTGKLGPYAVGALLIDDEAPIEGAAPDSPVRGEKARFGILRVSRDILKQSSVGFIFTDRELTDGFNRVAGVDGRFKLNPNWTAAAQAVTSRTRLTDGTEMSGPAYELRINRNARGFTTGINYRDFSAGFVTQPGFVRRTDIRRIKQKVAYKFWPEGKRLISWGPSLSWERIWDHEGMRLDRDFDLSLSWDLRRQTGLAVWYATGRERIRPQDFPDLTESLDFPQSIGGFAFSTRFSNRVNANLTLGGGDSVNFVTPTDGTGSQKPPGPADLTVAEMSLTLRPTGRLRIDNQYLLTRLSDPMDGGRIFRNQITRSRWSYQFTPQLTLRAILQYDATRGDPSKTRLETTRNFNGDLLLTYLVNPWTALFVGYNGNYQNLELVDGSGGPTLAKTSGDFLNDSRQFFVKFSYLFRL